MTNQQAIDQIWAMFRETDLKFKETALRFEETERLLKARSEETEQKFKETDRLMKARSDETDRKIKEVTASIGRLGNKLGDFVEEMVRPAAVRLFRERGIDVHEVHRNVEAQRDGDAIEVDLLRLCHR